MIRSLFSAVSGLLAHQESMDVIGNNIANVNTVGFKASTTEFGEAFSQTERLASESQPVGLDVGLGVRVVGTTTDFTQGAEETTSVPSNIMISGSGFFTVNTTVDAPAASATNSTTAGTGDTVYTRDGDFTVDKDGYMRTGDGYYVMGYSTGSSTNATTNGTTDTSGFVSGTVYSDFAATDTTGTLASTTLTAIQIPSTITTAIPATTAGKTAAALASTDAATNTTDANAVSTAATTQDTTPSVANAAALLVAAKVVYDPTSPATLAASTSVKAYNDAVLSAAANINTSAAAATQAAVTTALAAMNAAQSATSAATSAVANPTDGSYALAAKTAADASATDALASSSSAATASGDVIAAVTVTTAVVNYSVGTNGAINVVGQDGTNVTIGYVPLATFANQGGLANQGGGYFTPTKASDAAQIYTPGNGTAGTTVGGALELSNADVATEFSNMIIIQRGYDANSKVITVSNEMLQTADNLIQ